MTQSKEWLEWICSSADHDELSHNYDQWAQTYEVDIESAWRDIPPTAAKMLTQHLSATLEMSNKFDKSVPLLDVGAGTGMMGVALSQLGFSNIIGIDISSQMLVKAEQKGVYQSLICCAIAGEKVQSLDPVAGAIATGVFADRHAGPEDLKLIQGQIQSGGIFVFTVRRSFLPQLKSVLEQPEWIHLETRLMPIYEDPMYIFAYQIY